MTKTFVDHIIQIQYLLHATDELHRLTSCDKYRFSILSCQVFAFLFSMAAVSAVESAASAVDSAADSAASVAAIEAAEMSPRF